MSVELCSCGYQFTPAPRDSSLDVTGKVLIGLGIAVALWATFVFQTSVDDYVRSVENIGLLQRQSIYFQAGALMALAGTILVAAEAIVVGLSARMSPRSAQDQALGSSTSSSAGIATE
jgi:hypothetical protein